jgi:branched-subunit amino acid transport protein
MSEVWITVAGVAAITALIRAAGPVLFGGRPLRGPLGQVMPLMAPALLAGLVVSETLSDANGLVVDERLIGVGAAGAVLTVRSDSPILAVFVSGAVTALARLVLS